MSYAGAPPRKAKPPLRPLAPPAISRASNSRTRLPASASLSAQAQPVTPPPTTATSTGPADRSAGAARGERGSASQYELISMSAILAPRSHPPVKTVGLGDGAEQLELGQRRRNCRGVQSRLADEPVDSA